MTITQKEVLYHQLASLLRAGFPIEQSAESILGQGVAAAQRRYLEAVKAGVSQGRTIAESVEDHGSAMETALVRAAENGGRLADGFQHLADYFCLLKETQKNIFLKCAYPLTVLNLAAVVRAVVASFGGGASFLVELLKGLLLLWGAIGLIWLLVWWILRQARISSVVDRLLRLVPIVGGLWRQLAEARMAQVMKIALLSGEKTDQVFALGSEASASGVIREGAKTIVPAIAGGALMGSFLRSVLAKDMATGLALAEQSGQLDSECERFASLRMAEAGRSATLFGAGLAGMIFLTAAVTVGYLYLTFMTGRIATITEGLDL